MAMPKQAHRDDGPAHGRQQREASPAEPRDYQDGKAKSGEGEKIPGTRSSARRATVARRTQMTAVT